MLVACSQDSGIPAPEDFVFVPAKDYTISVEIVVPHEAVVGEWIPLRATRRSGPWQRLRYAEVAPDTKWFVVPPPEYESEVADNLRWLTEPLGAARFDLPTTATAITMSGRPCSANQASIASGPLTTIPPKPKPTLQQLPFMPGGSEGNNNFAYRIANPDDSRRDVPYCFPLIQNCR